MKFTQHTYDVVIIGGGAAGALAAIEARKADASVAFITKETALVGGATIMAAGGTSVCMSEGDNCDIFVSDIKRSGQQINNTKLAHLVAENSAEALFNLEHGDFLLDRKDLGRNGANSMHTIKKGEGHSFARAYLDRREALGFCHGIARAVMRHEVAIFAETVAAKILTKAGRAAGVIAFSLVTGEYLIFNAKSVIIATGGLGALYEETTNSAVLTGDGFAMALDLGIELIDMEMVQFMPLCFPYPKTRRGKIIGMCSLFGPKVKLYNGLGERYMGKYDPERWEQTTRDFCARGNFNEIREGRGTKNNAILVDATEAAPDILERFKQTTPFRYKQCVQAFGQEAADWKVPFEAIPAQHFFMGGIKIDEHLATSVPGVFAVGEVTGGVHGANRLSGVALSEIFVLGPIAGKESAKYAAETKLDTLDADAIARELEAIDAPMQRRGEGFRPFELKQKIRKVVSSRLGPVRIGEDIKAGIAELERIEKEDLPKMVIGSDELCYNRDRMEAIEVPFMLKTALAMAYAALTRKESRGAHFRLDFPKKDDENWVKNIGIKRSTNGKVEINIHEVV